MAVGDIYRLSARWQREVTGDDVVNVWHFRQDAPLVFDTAGEDLVAAFRNYCEPTYFAITSSIYVLDLYEVRQATGGFEIYQEVVSVPGTRGTDVTVLSAATSCVLNWRTGLAGRSNRGRTFMPPTAEGDLDTGQFIPGYLDGVNAFADAMIDDMSSLNILFSVWRLVVFSQVGGPHGTDITSYFANPNPAKMGSRRLGVGS